MNKKIIFITKISFISCMYLFSIKDNKYIEMQDLSKKAKFQRLVEKLIKYKNEQEAKKEYKDRTDRYYLNYLKYKQKPF